MAEAAPAAADTLVLGAAGYVGGELLRLLAHHPRLRLRAAVSGSRAGEAIAAVFPHLAGVYGEARLSPPDALEAAVGEGEGPLAVFAALPHTRSAPEVGRLLEVAEERGRPLALVDLSADFRHPDPAVYAAIYGIPHPAPGLLGSFVCALPDLAEGVPSRRIAHPGCFTTAVVLAAAPLVALGVEGGCLTAFAVTGSTGSGRAPGPGTHHPERHGDLRAYAPLGHRHTPEMERLLAAGGKGVEVSFLPHSGPFARGIYATVSARLAEPLPAAALAERLREFYRGRLFVAVGEMPPRLKDVVGTNRCALAVAARGKEAVVFAALDNLVKGAAGGAVQWMNRLLGLPEATGLEIPGLGWC